LSKIISAAVHPRTKEVEQVTFLNNRFGDNLHGVKFSDGSIWRVEEVQTMKHNPFFEADGIDM
jgi:hypothetical protein